MIVVERNLRVVEERKQLGSVTPQAIDQTLRLLVLPGVPDEGLQALLG
jgi:hypothetical protein